MKKRNFSFILACVLSITSLTACGSTKNADATTAAATEAVTDQTQAASGEESIYEKFQKRDPITIKWLAYNTYGQPDEANSKVIQEVEKKYNVKFDFWFVDDQQWDQVLGVKLASGEMPDIMKIKNINNTSVYYDQGVLAEITDDILNKMPHYKETIEKYDTDNNIWVDTMIDGKRYALKSLNYDSSYPTALVWRKDWLKNVGIDKIPETIDEWEEAMKRFTENDPDGNGKKDTYGMSNTTMNAIFGAYGAIPLKEFRSNGTQNLFMTKKDGKLVYAATQPETRQALEKLADWYKKGYIDPEFVTGENTGGYWADSQAFNNDKIGVTGMSMIAHWNPDGTGKVYDGFAALHPDVKWGETIECGPAPKGPEGYSGTHTWGIAGGSFGFTTEAMKDPAKIEVLCQLIDDNFADFDFATKLKWGYEGEDYKIEDSSYIPNTTKYPDFAASTIAGINILNLTISNPDHSKIWYKKMFEFNDKYKSTGYVDEKYPITESQNEFLTDLKSKTLETYTNIITGKSDITSFDEFVDLFNNKMGGSIIENEINAEMGNQ